MHDDENAAKKTREQCTSGTAGKGRLVLLHRWVAAADQEKIVIGAHLKTSLANGKKL